MNDAKMTESLNDDPCWRLDRRESSGLLFWHRDRARVKFRCDVEVVEYPIEGKQNRRRRHFNNDSDVDSEEEIRKSIGLCLLCMIAIALTLSYQYQWFQVG